MLHALGGGGISNALRILVAEPKGKRRFGSPRVKRGSNFKQNVSLIHWTVLDSKIHVAQTGIGGILFGNGAEPPGSVIFE